MLLVFTYELTSGAGTISTVFNCLTILSVPNAFNLFE